MMTDQLPEFWIDVGGTFTDCLARMPSGQLLTHKLLSSGVTLGSVVEPTSSATFVDPLRAGDPAGFWVGYELHIRAATGQQLNAGKVVAFDHQCGEVTCDAPLPSLSPGASYELFSHESAPIIAIRYLLGLRIDQPIPPIAVRLGTTRGTNALLTRSGARTALVTTKGFADVLRIGYQNRPRLFDLAITKPEPLFESVVEVDERIAADGTILRQPDEQTIKQQLKQLQATGVESLAICFMHAFAHRQHEQLVEQIAHDVGFTEISTSSTIAPLIKIVSRGDTTVVDAYLNPVLRQYVGELRAALGNSSLKLMTSAGGLVDAEHFVGKDSVLSGPAGGVIGFSRVAERAGFAKSIGFDMGGTSTDVARFGGSYEREYETEKAGVRIVAPMLAIETVAAGGGSVCDFDGVKLIVGPTSAGADPGPACYGRGGPLTVTDMNLFLGRILPSAFPFPLDREVVETKLNELCQRLAASPHAPPYSPHQLADGFLRIANANMVRAIRNISIAKGYNPPDHVLVTFGGAGGQHACAIARALGMSNVLVHPYAGILSAYGIGLADVRRFAQRAVLQVYTPSDDGELESLFAELESQAVAEVREQGVEASRIDPPLRSLDMRYQGTDATIDVPQPTDGDFACEFTRLHQQLFGFTRDGQAIEVAAARVEVVGRTSEVDEPSQAPVERQPTPRSTTDTWFDGASHTTGVFYRKELRSGDSLSGPAIVCEPTSTIVIDPGFTAEVTSRGELVITDSGRPVDSPARQSQVDPVQLEIFNNLFASIAEQMGTTLQRTAFSTNVKERRDYSCALFSPSGELVANAPHVPVHLGAMGETVRCILNDNPDSQPGDVFVTNDPFRGGSHLPDVTIVTPVHDADGALLFFTASRAHHAEIGGITPGSLPPMSQNLAEEGVLIRNFKLLDRGDSREAALKQLLLSGPHPTRAAGENLADIAAQIAANNRGASLLRELVSDYSLPVVHAYMQHIQDAAARKMRMALVAMPDGIYERTDYLDDGSPIRAAITINGESATVDFTGTGPVVPGNLNANRSIVTAGVLYTFRCMINEDIPLNGGVLEPVEIILPTCLLNPPADDDPAKCAAVVGGNVETSSRVVDVLLGALGLAAASQGTMNNFIFGDDTFGYYETIGGGSGATTDADGASAVHTHMTNTRLTDPEVLEHRYPVRVCEFSIRAGSGGAGQHRGGDGIIRKIEFLCPLEVSLLTERRGPYPPFGLEGGQPGALGVNTMQRAGSDDHEVLPAKVQLQADPGDKLTIETPGGGGYG